MKNVVRVFRAKGTIEGAGVRLYRGFSHVESSLFDPFLLFDDFSSLDSHDYIAGFPWHPHRGIETVSYIIKGAVKHRDSMGNAGEISDGAVQWMTAGKGIIHEEMPSSSNGIMGFQLWVNLPAEHKLMPARYQEIESRDIPIVSIGDHATAKIIAGEINDAIGPAKDLMISPTYIDVSIKPHKSVHVPVAEGHTVFVYVFEGTVIAGEPSVSATSRHIMLFERTGTELALHAGSAGARCLVVSGRPLGEQIAWHGPIVMNTEAELMTALQDLREGTFL